MVNKDILVIYPETKSTRIALYKGTSLLFLKNIKHKPEVLSGLKDPDKKLEFRANEVLRELKENDADLNEIEIIVGRGGLLKPLNAGVYKVNKKMFDDLKTGAMGWHHTNLGGLITFKIAKQINAQAILADPVSVDEMDKIARVSGHPLFERKSIFHSLNQKFFARKYAKAHYKAYEEVNLIIATVGMGGISVAAHRKGNVVDVNNAFDGDGPFSIKRSGSVPVGDLVRLAYSGKYTEEEMIRLLTKEGGYAAYLGTGNLHEIDDMMASGDEKALFISDACAYQVSKEIGAMYAVLEGEVDAIILTGNIFHSERFLENIKKRVGKVADFAIYPSVNDIEALAENAFLVLKGELNIQEYD
ncbi:MAG: butyrate kinase [Bacteroidetes bacterium 4484_249]|nr:MAG: butyrate kinase [Bacteroidetes bacterium 4484_249]